MRLIDDLMHLPDHNSLENMGIDSHHDQPENIEIFNTTLQVYPLPGGPGVWDINLTDEAEVVMFTFRSNHDTWQAGAKAGVIGVASENQLRTTTMTWGGHGTKITTSYNMVYSKAAAALNLSDKIFSTAGDLISLTECYIRAGSPKQLRTEWTNYGSTILTLNVWGQIAIIG